MIGWYGPCPGLRGGRGLVWPAEPPLTQSFTLATFTGLPLGSVLPHAAVPSGPNRPPKPGAGTALSLSFRLWQLVQPLAANRAWPRPTGVSEAAAAATAGWG